jgi:D-lactate dehydrogenase
LQVIDAVQFVAEDVLPAIAVVERLRSVAVHPTCSSTRLGINEPLLTIARAIAEDVVVPDDWGCCAFAGDRGMLHPDLTGSATGPEAASLESRTFAAYASCNRTCEMGMTRATGHQYQHVLELLECVSRTDRRTDKSPAT